MQAPRATWRAWTWRLYAGVAEEPEAYKPAVWLELALVLWVLLFVVAVVLDTDPGVMHRPTFVAAYFVFSVLSGVVFSLELGARLWSCAEEERYAGHPLWGRLKLLKDPLVAADLVAVVAIYADICTPTGFRSYTVFRLARFVRLFALVRVERRYGVFATLRVVTADKSAQLLVALVLSTLLVLCSGFVMFYLESETNRENFESIGAGLWWSVNCLTTVGYGDKVPATIAGRVFGAVVALLGSGLAALPVALISSGFLESALRKHVEDDKERVQRASIAHPPYVPPDPALMSALHALSADVAALRREVAELKAR